MQTQATCIYITNIQQSNKANKTPKSYRNLSVANTLDKLSIKFGTCGLSVTTFFHQVLNYYYLTVYIMFKPKMSLEGSVH